MQHNLEAAYVTSPVSIAYLTGFRADPHERLMALAVRADRATLVVPALEQERASTNAEHAPVLSWRDGEDPYALVREALGACARLAVEKEHLTVKAAESISSVVGARELVDVAPELRRLRRTKNQAELDKLARQQGIEDDLLALVEDHAVTPDCGQVGVPNHAPVPLLALYLKTSPREIISAQVSHISSGVYVDPASKEVERDYVLDPHDPARPVSVPPGFTEAHANRSWLIFQRCS